MHLVVAYDVHEDANRRRVRKTLQRYGAWRQFSVFELDISKTDRVEMEDELEDHIDESDGDRIRIWRLCRSCVGDIVTLGNEPPDNQSNVV